MIPDDDTRPRFFVSYAYVGGFGCMDFSGPLPWDFENVTGLQNLICAKGGFSKGSVVILSWQRYGETS